MSTISNITRACSPDNSIKNSIAADEPIPIGFYKRGYQLYLEGKYEEAEPVLVVDANHNHEPSQRALGFMYMEGLSVPIDYSKAVGWFIKSAYLKNPTSDSTVAGIYHYGGPELQPDYQKAVFWYKNCIVNEYTKSIRAIAGLYTSGGYGLEKDYREAIYWYTKVALSKDDDDAMYRIGNLYLEGGFGIIRDFDDAVFWLSMATEYANADAKYQMAKFYQTGDIVGQNYQRSLEYFEEAYEGGNAEACFEVGCIYEYGYGVEIDYVKSLGYYRKAAHLASSDAQLKLGKIYLEGWADIPIDEKESMIWLQRAIISGNEEAQLVVLGLETPVGTAVPMVHSTPPSQKALYESAEIIAKLKKELELQRFKYNALKESMANKQGVTSQVVKSEPKKFFQVKDSRQEQKPIKYFHVENSNQSRTENEKPKFFKVDGNNTAALNSNEQEDQKKKKHKMKFFKL
ncbi:hypothetical protein INT48_007484 [Thamnidium elegans]|uniref:HCP-like protein n=1 Tax=Thamnidium elegans TaxID=101142 RepID=A0A8H7SJ21_9FUNG|nr:hypothetical protein INT48_007484 [Thamnidium elegans]